VNRLDQENQKTSVNQWTKVNLWNLVNQRIKEKPKKCNELKMKKKTISK